MSTSWASLSSWTNDVSSGHQLQNSKDDRHPNQQQQQQQQQQRVMMEKYMTEETSTIPYGILQNTLQYEQPYGYQHHSYQNNQKQQSLQYLYGTVEGSDPEGYQGSNSISDAHSADVEGRRFSQSQEHYMPADIAQSLYPHSAPDFLRQGSPSSSDASGYVLEHPASGVVDPKLLNSGEQDLPIVDADEAFDSQSYFTNMGSPYMDEPEDTLSLDGGQVDAVGEPFHFENDHGLCYNGPARSLTMDSMATTVVEAHDRCPDCTTTTYNNNNTNSAPSSTSYSNTENSTTSTVSNTSSTPSKKRASPVNKNNKNGSGKANKHRRKNSTSSGSDSNYSDHNGDYSSHPKSSRIYKKKPKSTCRECGKKFQNQSELRKHTESTHTKPYRCMFTSHPASCMMTFGARNEWKRHITSMHLRRELYRCQESRCQGKPAFNRRDLFAKHVGRMHEEPASMDKMDPGYEASKARVGAIANQCRIQREGPSVCRCGFCGEQFGGADSINKMLDHVGQHFQLGDACSKAEWRRDLELERWMFQEGLVKRGNRVSVLPEDEIKEEVEGLEED